MIGIVLYRLDDAKRMRRYYRMNVQHDLFGQWCLLREWGRIGSTGQTRSLQVPTAAEAHAALCKQYRSKERRGYVQKS